ncbi:Peptidase inhibitor 16 [Lamellibrachia satsuma]|nr:Peptidase inhibitor 16 [Lamellibrachia satsuma]
MAAMGLLCVVLTALFAFGATLEVQSNGDEQYMVSVGGESPLPDPGNSPADTAGPHDASSRRRREVCGIPYELSEADKQAVLDAHNQVRRLEGASDMLKLTWSDSLARRAAQWASECKWKHGLLTSCDDGTAIGQNLHMSKVYEGYPTVNVSNVVKNGWWAEKKFYTYSSMGCQTGKMCGHYTQVVWAKSYEVGCSIARCPLVTEGVSTPWTKASILACDYNPAGNYNGQKPFVKGTACNNCPSVVQRGYRCSASLCERCDPATSATCTCVEKTCVSGVFDKNLCKCVCPEGKYGELCSSKYDTYAASAVVITARVFCSFSPSGL